MWEAIGVVSYLLINFYFTRIQSNKAAMLAFTMNRGGDMLMSIGFFAIFSIFGSLNYSEVFTLVPYINETAITINFKLRKYIYQTATVVRLPPYHQPF